MKKWGKYIQYIVAAACILGLTGCHKPITACLDGAALPLTKMEDQHWISVEGLQEYGFALQEGEKGKDGLKTNWLLYPLPPNMKTLERKEIVLQGESEGDNVYCNGLLLPTKVIDGELMVSVEELAKECSEQAFMTYGGILENTESLQQSHYGAYLIGKKEEVQGEWRLKPLRPTMPLRTPWGCMLFEKVLTDDISFTAESFSTDYVSLPELAENMGLSMVLHKGILHLYSETDVEAYQVPVESVAKDFLNRRLISGYLLTGEGMRVACVYDGRKLYGNMADLQEVLREEGYAYEEATRTFAKSA